MHRHSKHLMLQVDLRSSFIAKPFMPSISPYPVRKFCKGESLLVGRERLNLSAFHLRQDYEAKPLESNEASCPLPSAPFSELDSSSQSPKIVS